MSDAYFKFVFKSVPRFTWKVVSGVIKPFYRIPAGMLHKDPKTFGDAHWATRKELKKANLLSGKGFILGRFKKKLVTVADRGTSTNHITVFGKTQSGKSNRIIKTNIFEADDCNIICIDPKGELRADTEGYRKKIGYTINFTPTKPDVMHRFDPMTYCDIGRSKEFRSIQELAYMVKPREKHAASEHFNALCRTIFSAMALHLWRNEPEHASFVKVVQMLLSHEQGVREDVLKSMRFSKEDVIKAAAAAQQRAGDREAGSFDTTMQHAFGGFLDEEIANFCQPIMGEGFQWETVWNSDKPCTVYIQPELGSKDIFSPWLRIIIGTCVGSLLRRGVSARKTIFMLDEAAELGDVPVIMDGLQYLEGLNGQMVFAYQN